MYLIVAFVLNIIYLIYVSEHDFLVEIQLRGVFVSLSGSCGTFKR